MCAPPVERDSSSSFALPLHLFLLPLSAFFSSSHSNDEDRNHGGRSDVSVIDIAYLFTGTAERRATSLGSFTRRTWPPRERQITFRSPVIITLASLAGRQAGLPWVARCTMSSRYRVIVSDTYVHNPQGITIHFGTMDIVAG